MKVNILGAEYTIKKEQYKGNKELELKNRTGYCFYLGKEIVYADYSKLEGYEDETKENIKRGEAHILRHEIIHAFLFESGLSCCSCKIEEWADNEEMVDWFAIQSPKIFKVFKDLDIL